MKIFRFVLTVSHFFIIVLLLGTLLNAYIPPKVFPWFNLLSLAFPVLMIMNVLMIVFWIILRKKRAFLFVMFSLILINPTRRWVNFSAKKAESPNLKIVTYNVKGGAVDVKLNYTYLEKQNADIILGQEYGSEFNIPGFENRTRDYEIVALNSKYKIVNQGKLTKTGNGNSFFADIDVNGKIIRFVNVYLNPFSFDKAQVKPGEDFETNSAKAKFIVKRLLPTFKVHQQEVAEIRTAIDNSPYPVILAGDFNSVPNSYEYYHLGKGLRDVFMEVGKGSSTSFHDYKFPIRIDYVFCSKEIKPVSYKVDRSVKVSDHFPVIAEFKIN